MKNHLLSIAVFAFILVTSLNVFSQCSNVTNGGTVGSDQTSCTNFNPAAINNVTLPSGGTGTIEYQWQSSLDGTTWTNVGGATAQNYDPPFIIVTTYYQRLSRRSGCTTYDGISNMVTKTIYGLPPASISAGGPVIFCGPGSVVLTANAGAGLAYQWYKDGNMISGETGQNYTASQQGSYQVQVISTVTFCTAFSNSILVTVHAPLVTTITYSGFSTCLGSTALLNVQSDNGYSYQWYEDSHPLPDLNIPSLSTGHNGTYSCVVTNACGSYPSAPYILYDLLLDIIPYGTISASGSTSVCNGQAVSMYEGLQSFAGYQWYKDGVAIPGETSYYYTALTPGDYVLRITDYCPYNWFYYDFYSNWITITSNGETIPVPVISAGGPTTFCSGSSVLLMESTGPGWTYQWINSGGYISGATNSTYNASVSGFYYCLVSNICGSFSSNSISVNVLPVSVSISLSGPSTICTGASVLLTATNSGSGGTYLWSLNGASISGATLASYNASASGNYACSITNACGTATSNQIAILVSSSCATGLQLDGANDYARIPNNPAYAFGTGNFTVEGWIKLSSTQTYSSPTFISNRALGTNSGFIVKFTGGRLSLLTGGNSVSAGSDLRDNACHHVAVTRYSATSVALFVDGVQVGSTSNGSANVNSTTVLTLGNDEHIVSYFKGNMMEVRLWNVSRTLAEIQSSMNNGLSGGEPGLVGYWKLDDGSGQVINDYSLTNNDGQLGSTPSSDINDPLFGATCPLNSCTLPVASISAGGPLTFCSGNSVTLNATTGPGITFQWRLNGSAISGATLSSYVATGAGNFSCLVTNGCGTSASNTITTYVFTPPIAAISAGGPPVVCNGSSVTLSAPTGNGYSYQWSVDGGNIALATASTYIASVPGDYACTVSNVCGSATSNIITVTVNTVPAAPGFINGTSTVCTNSPGVSFSVNAVSGATSYVWTVPSGASVSSGQGTNSITVDFGSAASAGNICVSASNDCGASASFCTAISVSSVPIITGNISGSSSACANSTGNLYSITPVAGAQSYTWTVPQGATISNGQGTSSITINYGSNGSTGNICVYAGNGCGASFTCKSVTAVTAPATPAAISGTINPCAGSTGIIYSCSSVANAISYSWNVPAFATITGGQGTTSITVSFGSSFTSGSVAVSAVNCAGPGSSRTIQVYGTPAMPGSIAGPVTGVCAGSTNIQYSIAAVPGASGYTWTTSQSMTITSGQGTTAVLVKFNGGFSSGSLSVSASNNCGFGPARSITINSVPLMPGTISGPVTFCSNQSGVGYSVGLVSGATSYNWVVPVGAVVASGQGTQNITVNFGTHSGKIKVNAGNACGTSSYTIMNVYKTCREGEVTSGDWTETKVEVFPNPSGNQFTLNVRSENKTVFNLTLRDLAGRLIETHDGIDRNQPFVFGEELIPGVYLLELKLEEETKVLRLIRQ